MTLFEFLKVSQRDYDTYDTEYDAVVTVCFIEKEIDYYDKFCNNIIKKVSVVKQVSDNELLVSWSEMIENNIDEFKDFTTKHWKDVCQYEDDIEEFVYQWIQEIHNYIAGNVSESFYKILVDFIETLD